MQEHNVAAYRALVRPRHRHADAARDLARVLARPSNVVISPASSRKLLTPAARGDLVALLRAIRDLSCAAGKDGLRGRTPENDATIAAAAARLVATLRTGGAAGPGIEASVTRLADAVVEAMNIAALEHDIDRLSPPKGFQRLGMEQRRRRIAEMTDRLATLHGRPRDLVERMIELRHDTETEQVTARAIIDLYRTTWRSFGVGEDRRSLLKLTAIILVNRLMHNASPLLWTKIFDGQSFNAEYMIALGGLDIIDAHSSKYETEVSTNLMFTIRQRIHALAVKALFVRDLGLSDQFGSGELFDVIWKGEDAYNNIVRSLLFDGVPTLLTIPIVLGGLTFLHPLLGALGLLSIPAVYWLARRTGPDMQLAREEGLEKKRALFTRGNTMVEGIETLLAQGHLAGGRRSFLDLEREGDSIDRDMINRWAKIHLIQRYPTIITGLVTALFGAYLVKRGLISPGGVITTADYATRLRTTIVDMIHRYFEQFPRELNDARALQRLIDWSQRTAGDESAKIKPSTLPSTRIACDGLAYKSIVKNLSISAEAGEFVTISGTSGIGKTTLLRLIGGLYRPSAGRVTIGGVAISDIAAEGEDSLFTLLSISSQSPYIFDDMTLRQNLVLFNPDPAVEKRAAEVLDWVGLGKLIPDLDRQEKRRLSGGERVRFGLARALLKLKPDQPMIALLDEPTASLAEDGAPGSAGAIRQLLAKLHATHPKLTLVCVTHDKQLVALAGRDISLSAEQVSRLPEPKLNVRTGRREIAALPGIVVDFGKP